MTRLTIPLLLAAILGLGLLAPACDDPYDDNDLELLTRYRAKDMCSCLFVMERDQTYCAAWTQQPPNLATYVIDWDRREVRTQALMFWAAKARFQDEHFGCVLE